MKQHPENLTTHNASTSAGSEPTSPRRRSNGVRRTISARTIPIMNAAVVRSRRRQTVKYTNGKEMTPIKTATTIAPDKKNGSISAANGGPSDAASSGSTVNQSMHKKPQTHTKAAPMQRPRIANSRMPVPRRQISRCAQWTVPRQQRSSDKNSCRKAQTTDVPGSAVPNERSATHRERWGAAQTAPDIVT